MKEFFVIFGLFVFIVAMYLGTYILNKNTKVTEGITEVASCSACNSTSCSVRDKKKEDITPEECELDIII